MYVVILRNSPLVYLRIYNEDNYPPLGFIYKRIGPSSLDAGCSLGASRSTGGFSSFGTRIEHSGFSRLVCCH